MSRVADPALAATEVAPADEVEAKLDALDAVERRLYQAAAARHQGRHPMVEFTPEEEEEFRRINRQRQELRRRQRPEGGVRPSWRRPARARASRRPLARRRGAGRPARRRRVRATRGSPSDSDPAESRGPGEPALATSVRRPAPLVAA